MATPLRCGIQTQANYLKNSKLHATGRSHILALTGNGYSIRTGSVRVSDWSPRRVTRARRESRSHRGRDWAWGGHKGFIPIVDATTGRELARLDDPHQDVVFSLVFSGDGTKLVGVSSESYCVRVWDLRLIREGLRQLELDWEAPSFPPLNAAEPRGLPLQVALVGAQPLLNTRAASQDQIDAQIAVYRKRIDQNPDDVNAYLNLALCGRAKGQVVQAIEAYQKAIELRPDHAQAYNSLGFTLYGQEKFNEAAAEYAKAISIDPENVIYRRNLASALRSGNRFHEAIIQYSKAIELESNEPIAHYGRA